MNSIDPNATKYLVKAKINADGVVDKPDVVGAIFGQTEGLLGDDLDLRDLQKSGRIGRIEVDVACKGGKSDGIITMASSLDQVETSIISAALETIDRVGPCKASIKVIGIEDVRITKREKIVDRAKELLAELVEQARDTGSNLANNIRQSVQVEEITTFGKERCPAGPNVKNSEAIIIVEGRSDVLNLLRAGIKNAVAVEGTNIPKSIQDLSRERVTTAFVDGDRGGELILRELFQTSEIDFVARAPRSQEVEELTAKALVKCLRNKVPGDQYMQMNNLHFENTELETEEPHAAEPEEEEEREPRRERRDRSERRGRDFDEDDSRRNRRERRSRDYEDEEEDARPRRRDRSERRGRHSENRFDNDAADRFKKRRTEEIPDDYEVEVEVEVADEEPAEETVYEEPVTAAETPAEEPAEEEVVIDEPAAEPEEEAVAETPAEEPATEPEEEAPAIELRPNKRDAKNKKSSKMLTPQQEALRTILLDVIGTHNAVLLDGDNQEIGKIQVKELAEYLNGPDSPAEIAAIASDGVIGQRLVDVAAQKNIPVLVGKKKGKITKLPSEITVWVKDDLD
ncbi:MAG: DNA primase [Thermoplasmata archaeon]|nr:DNA primase [Thermoplasmata archaeon]